MINQSFSHSSLSRCLYSKDFFEDENLSNDVYRKQKVDRALEIADSLYQESVPIETVTIAKKVVYCTTNLSEKLVLRRCVENIKSKKIVRLKQRDVIGKELISYLKEGTPYRIYRFDIKAFFESIDISDIKISLSKIDTLSTHTKNIIFSYLNRFNSNHGSGIPRGIEISPIISEILLLPFDKEVRGHEEVFYYSRFVDDIIIISSSLEDENLFSRWVRKQLPGQLRLNQNKRYIATVPKRRRSGAVVAKFDYLGYEFCVTDTVLNTEYKCQFINREVKVDISTSKIKKFKIKISQSLYNHQKNNNFELLYDRLYFLLSNRDLKDKNKKRSIPTGIYYNYSLLSANAQRLSELDNFLKFSILNSRTRLGRLVYNSLTTLQRKKLLKLSFALGFRKRIYKKYSPDRLKQITQIW